MDVKLRMEKELEQPQQEMKELQKMSQRRPRDTNHLEEQLVDKNQQLSDARKRRQRRNMIAMNQLSAAALEESRQKLDGLQLNHQTKLEEQDTILQSQLEPTKSRGERGHQRELSEKEERTQRQQESFRRKLRELSELWQARTRQAAEKHGEPEEKIQQKMENTKDEEPSQRNQLNNKRERQKIRRSSSGLCGDGRSGDGQ